MIPAEIIHLKTKKPNKLSGNTGMTGKTFTIFFILLFALSSFTYSQNRFYRFETGGAFSLGTFNNSVNLVLIENLGFNLTPSVNISISGE